jgi:hypothetical protein
VCPICDGASAGVAVMPIDPSLEQGAFEPEATAAMGEAFEAACRKLHGGGDSEARKLIAKRIIAAARKGELDPVRLRTTALSWIIVTPNAACGFVLS